MVPPNMGKAYTKNQEHLSRSAKKNKATLIPFLLNGVGGVEN